MGDQKREGHETTRIMGEGSERKNFQTQRLKTMFPGKTDAEIVRINRRFLQDAEPFSLSNLKEAMTTDTDGLSTGFEKFDADVSIPEGALTLVCGGAKRGKTLFMLNLLYNAARAVRGKHMLYYTCETTRPALELKLINLAGTKPFDLDAENPRPSSNLACWKRKLTSLTEAELLKFAAAEGAYAGLKNFMEVAGRIHLVDGPYDVSRLIESIRLFSGPFRVGAVFIDFLQGVSLEEGYADSAPAADVEKLNRLRRFAAGCDFPIVVATQISPAFPLHLEEDGWRDWPASLEGLQHFADLILAVQRLPHPDENVLIARVLASRIGHETSFRFAIDPHLFNLSESG